MFPPSLSMGVRDIDVDLGLVPTLVKDSLISKPAKTSLVSTSGKTTLVYTPDADS